MLRQYRHPARTRFVELPAGLLDVARGGPARGAARRELLEEAALRGRSWTHLLTTYTSPGIIGERIEVYLARRAGRGRTGVASSPQHEEADMTLGVGAGLDDLLDGRPRPAGSPTAPLGAGRAAPTPCCAGAVG